MADNTAQMTVRAVASDAQLTVNILAGDNVVWAWGDDKDFVVKLTSAVVAADAEPDTSVYKGTSDHQGTAANSVVLSNITANGDVQGLVNNGGNSLEWLLVDASAKTITLGFGFSTASTSTTTGSVVVYGGLGLGGALRMGDDQLFALGLGNDVVALNRSTALAADTALTGVLLDTTVGSRRALDANSLIVSQALAAGGDMGFYVTSSGGITYQWLLADISATTVYVGQSRPTVTNTVTVEHRDATSATSHASLNVIVTHTSADPSITLQTAARTSYIGVDNSIVGDPLYIGDGTTVGSSAMVQINTVTSGTGLSSFVRMHINPSAVGVTLDNAVNNRIIGLAIGAFTTTLSNTTTPKTTQWPMLEIGSQTIVFNAAGVVNVASGIIVSPFIAGAFATISDNSGIRVTTAAQTGASTRIHGIYIEDQTGGTADYGLTIEGADTACIWVSSAVDTTDAANGIAFGLSRDTNLYRSAANTLKTDDNVAVGLKVTSYNAVATVGWGVPAVYGTGRSTAQTAAVATVATYTVGAADGTFQVQANVLVTTATDHSFTVTVTYTDEGNTARTTTMTFGNVAGTITVTSIANANGAVPYHGIPLTIRCKAATAITIATTGTFTTVTYNVEGHILQIA